MAPTLEAGKAGGTEDAVPKSKTTARKRKMSVATYKKKKNSSLQVFVCDT